MNSLRIGDSVHVNEIPLPEGVELVGEADSTVCVVSAPRAVVETVAPTEEAEVVAEPEVIGKAKKEEEEEEAEKK